MGVMDTIRAWWGGGATVQPSTPPKPSPSFNRAAVLAGRVSADAEQSVLARGFSSLLEIAPPTPDEDWRAFSLDSRTLERISPARLLKLLADLSPDVSKALWDFILFCNPGFTCKAYRPGTDKVDEEAQALVDEFLAKLGANHGTVDVVFGRMFFAIFLRGGVCMELVLGRDGRTPVDFATPDPLTLKFERVKDDVRGEVFRMYQWQGGQKVYLDRPTIRYVPLHPFPGSPYGRPMVAPALFSTLFLLGMLHDLRRVVSQQGYPRIDVELQLQALKEMMPPEEQDDPDKLLAWVQRATAQFQSVYAQLQPDDAYFHTDTVKVNRPVGTVDASSLKGAADLIQTLERLSIRALKTIPLLMASNQSTTETQANREYESHVAGIKSVQHSVETPFSHLIELGLQAQGRQATVVTRFAELRAAELLRDAQVEALKIRNEREKYAAGWTTQDEASEKVTGHKAAEKEPRSSSAGSTGNLIPTGGMAADPGSERMIELDLDDKPNGHGRLVG